VQYDEDTTNPIWWTNAILKIVFGYLISQRHIVQCEIWSMETESHADPCHMTKTANFENSSWRTAAILKMVYSLYLSRQLSDFDEICYADPNFDLENGYEMKNQNFPKPNHVQMADGHHIENRFLAIDLSQRRIVQLMQNLE